MVWWSWRSRDKVIEPSPAAGIGSCSTRKSWDLDLEVRQPSTNSTYQPVSPAASGLPSATALSNCTSPRSTRISPVPWRFSGLVVGITAMQLHEVAYEASLTLSPSKPQVGRQVTMRSQGRRILGRSGNDSMTHLDRVKTDGESAARLLTNPGRTPGLREVESNLACAPVPPCEASYARSGVAHVCVAASGISTQASPFPTSASLLAFPMRCSCVALVCAEA
ncbi:hypothetical protein V8E51_004683 [Hyaloscypha variabilis]